MATDPALSALAENGRVGPEAGEGCSGGAPLDFIGDTSERRWDEVFDEQVSVTVGADTFCCYTAGLGERRDGVVCVLLHGGGHCALSWGMVAEALKRSCGVVAFDSRGHGDSRCEDEEDISAQVQVDDAAAVVRGIYAARGADVPSVVLVGHSMGGAIAVRLAASRLLGDAVKGLVVIDVVEGTAMAALPHMRVWLSKRKAAFESIEKGVRYVVRAGHVRNVASARLSVPRQLAYRPERKRWVWRTGLEASSQYWHGWFDGLSNMFLSVPAAKMLVLAGIDRLDKDLMIAQMQGKFQNMVIPGAGHVVHEDRPDQTADVLLEYLRRNMLISDSKEDDGGDGGGGGAGRDRSRLPPCC
jgi:protein phosphatase methylesterase 1